MFFPILQEIDLFNENDWEKADFSLVIKDHHFLLQSFENLAQELTKIYPDDKLGIESLLKNHSKYAQTLSMVFETENNFLFQKGANRFGSMKSLVENVFSHLPSFKDSFFIFS